MSTFAKVLTFFNGIAAVFLLVIAAMNYSEFRTVRYSAFAHERALYGLPVDEHEIHPDHPDDPIVEMLVPGVLKDVFTKGEGGQDLGGPPVRTVMEEIERVRAKVSANIDAQGTPQLQRQKIRGYLLLQAKDIKERDELLADIETADIPKLKADLDRRFAVVKNQHQPAPGNNWEVVRFAAAPLLVNLSDNADWLERVRIVLGFDALVFGLDSSSQIIKQMASAVKEAIIRDQGTFRSNYDEMVQQLKYDAENLYQSNKRLGEVKGVVKDRELDAQKRRTEVEKNRGELAALTAEHNVEVAKMEAIQRDLFALQQRLGLALQASRELEQQLRQRVSGK